MKQLIQAILVIVIALLSGCSSPPERLEQRTWHISTAFSPDEMMQVIQALIWWGEVSPQMQWNMLIEDDPPVDWGIMRIGGDAGPSGYGYTGRAPLVLVRPDTLHAVEDLEGVTIHEIGHWVLGADFEHSPPGSSMSAPVPDFRPCLSEAEAEAICARDRWDCSPDELGHRCDSKQMGGVHGPED